MNAAQWIRSRQEANELQYWFSIVGYEIHDHSWNNRLYLLYVLIFFSSWILMTLIFFANGAKVIFNYLPPLDPIQATIFVVLLLMAMWFNYSLWKSLHSSPVRFSEEDALLLCQTPVNHRDLVIRWFWMPWIKSFAPFLLIALTMGFFIVEISLPGRLTISFLPTYILTGLQTVLIILPIHFGLFILNWLIGILRLQKDKERYWMPRIVMPISVILSTLILVLTISPSLETFLPLGQFTGIEVVSILTVAGNKNLILVWAIGWIFIVILFTGMAKAAQTFNLSRAAQESSVAENIRTARQYGLVSYAENTQNQLWLGMGHKPANQSVFPGASILVWKDIIQSRRIFRLSSLSNWFTIFLLMFSFALLPERYSRAFILSIWVIQISQISVIRLQNDLSRWFIVRQLPIPFKKFLVYDLIKACLFLILSSLLGLWSSSIFFRIPMDGFAIYIPGIVMGNAGITAYDVIRQASSEGLIHEAVPGVSILGVFLSLGLILISYLVDYLLPGLPGALGIMIVSLGFGIASLLLASNAYRNLAQK
ncbi:MAG: hypothetical protein CVU46_02570 [Chloroflexi bacterium HGW-Chloroflexi-8]|nr:MAG: hypothetical protein CVU46_02570 [Chloroflexi bacterium HGW-Chloroflexi-8]